MTNRIVQHQSNRTKHQIQIVQHIDFGGRCWDRTNDKLIKSQAISGIIARYISEYCNNKFVRFIKNYPQLNRLFYLKRYFTNRTAFCILFLCLASCSMFCVCCESDAVSEAQCHSHCWPEEGCVVGGTSKPGIPGGR
jgi:hypothetical protein